MNILSDLFSSSLGKKYLMAVSGLVLVLFAIGHMIGNLQVFLPPEAINRYAHFLQSNVELLWPVRLFLLAMVALHIWSAVTLTLENKEARPVPYAVWKPNTASFASRTMIWSGLIVGAFIVYHLLHYTVRLETVNGLKLDFHSLKDPSTGHPDVYAMVVAGFSVWYVSLFYIVAVALLCNHLSHGISAMFQSLGLRNPYYSPLVKKLALGVSIVLFVGYASVPAAVMLGLGKDYTDKVRAAAVAPQRAPAQEAK